MMPFQMDRLEFQSKTGFLNHVIETYDVGSPYMQGFYLSENAWHDNRDAEGYQLPRTADPEGNDSKEGNDSDDDLHDKNWVNSFSTFVRQMMSQQVNLMGDLAL